VGTNTVVVDAECFVSPRENERLILDFDVADSLQTGGTGFVFDPTLRLMQEDHSGSVSGTVQFQTTTPTNAFEARVELVNDAGQVVAKSGVDIESLAPISAVDREGNIASVIQSVYQHFGSGVVALRMDQQTDWQLGIPRRRSLQRPRAFPVVHHLILNGDAGGV
jgi:hypothetical protein